jgi:hypothetical protein
MVKKPFTSSVRLAASSCALGKGQRRICVHTMPYVADRAMLADATDLIAQFGGDAPFEAAARADRSRDLGNVLHFCRWRQVERLVAMLTADEVIGTVH